MTKKSWFANMMGMEREEYRHTITIRNKEFNQVKAAIVHAFLSVSTFKSFEFSAHCLIIRISITIYQLVVRKSSVVVKNARG